MEHLIQLLPDHIANQIAAGEVVQRPASVVKELLENAVDAGSTEIKLEIKDAGKTLVQVIDNGAGMSSQDARMAFERHATSKIRTSGDLFGIRTMGFRGEAMASIAAVAQVTLRTRLQAADLGTEVCIEGSEVKKHEPVMTLPGTMVQVKNLFFNVPARRNFLKSNPVETRHVINEFLRVALGQPAISMKMVHNGTPVYDLPAEKLADRLVRTFGKDLKGELLIVDEETSYIKMKGYAGSPSISRKARGEQFFFVNNRYIKSPYLNHAISEAYKNLIPQDHYPFYCIFLEIDPKHVDINIHPTKTEVKFDDERTIYSLLSSVIRKSLGNYLRIPEVPESPVSETIKATPFPVDEKVATVGKREFNLPDFRKDKVRPEDWEKLFETPSPTSRPQYTEPTISRPVNQGKDLFEESGTMVGGEFDRESEPFFVQLKQRFILTQVKSGLIVIDQQHAHQRILFEEFLAAQDRPPLAIQQLLFPQKVEMAPADFQSIQSIEPKLRHLGFDLNPFGENCYMVQGVPAELPGQEVGGLLEEIVAEMREIGHTSIREKIYTILARSIASRGAIPSGKKLGQVEMKKMVEQLFQCNEPAVTPSGKPTLYKLNTETLLRFFQKS